MIPRRAAALVLVAAALASAACSGTTPTLQGAVEKIAAEFEGLLGVQSLPGKYVSEIVSVHEDERTWRLKASEADALERCREAVRGLATADYGSWRETAVVVALLSSISQEHPSSLVRAEALDSLSRMSGWTFAAVGANERRPTEDELIAALQRIGDAQRTPSTDPGAAADVADALNTLAAYRFDRTKPLPEKVDRALLGRGSRTQLVMARRILRSLTGGALQGYDADPRVREATDRALVSASASAIRLSLIAAAVSGPADVVRTAAVRDLAYARPEQTERILGAVLREDESSSVRREAARALGTFPEAEAVPQLLPALADDRFEVRSTAGAALGSVTGQTFGDDRVAWVRWWNERSGAAGGGTPK